MGTKIGDNTKPESIMLAAAKLDGEGQSPFSSEALIVAAWQMFPRLFGMKGYPQFPDSNVVISYLCGPRSLPARGYLEKVGPKLYALTRSGRAWVRAIRGEPDQETAPAPTSLSRELNAFAVAVLNSRAARLFEEGHKTDLRFADAVAFWGIGAAVGPKAEAALMTFAERLNALAAAVEDGDAELGDGRVVSAGEVRVLRHVDDYLRDRFPRHILLLTERRGKSAAV